MTQDCYRQNEHLSKHCILHLPRIKNFCWTSFATYKLTSDAAIRRCYIRLWFLAAIKFQPSFYWWYLPVCTMVPVSLWVPFGVFLFTDQKQIKNDECWAFEGSTIIRKLYSIWYKICLWWTTSRNSPLTLQTSGAPNIFFLSQEGNCGLRQPRTCFGQSFWMCKINFSWSP